MSNYNSLQCLSRLSRDLPYLWMVNPALGHEVEPKYHLTPAAVKKHVAIIGVGPAGLECAVTVAQRGHTVTAHPNLGWAVLFEKREN